MSTNDQRALRERAEARFEVVPLSDAVALRPKTRLQDVRLIEIGDGGITINGDPVSGREVRERLGTDADLVLRLSYLSSDERRALFAARSREAEAQPERPAETPIPPAKEWDRARGRHARGDRVRIFGNVAVEQDEEIAGQAVAVLGSVRVDGEVGDQVVAVLGSVVLGPEAVVRGDVVSIGGTVRRAPTAKIGGGITEVSLDSAVVDGRFAPWVNTWMPFYFFNRFAAVPRLIGSTFRLGLLMLLAVITLVVARPIVEGSAARVSDNPIKAMLVGLLAQVLLVPVMVLIVIVLAVSIIGIPLLFLLPFAVLLLLLMALAGFTGTACAVGHWTRRRIGIVNGSAVIDVCLGVAVILLPLMIGRVLALAGWPVTPIVMLLVATGFAVELLAWSSGFGAVLTNVFARWQARRASRAPLQAPPAAS
jgi:hypothetical protein